MSIMHLRFKIITFFGFVSLAIIATAGTAHANAPFCVKAPGVQEQCYYYNASQCRAKAKNMTGGFCTINRSRVTLPASTGYFCLVTSVGAIECNFHNFSSCERQTRSKNAVCVQSPNQPPNGRSANPDAPTDSQTSF